MSDLYRIVGLPARWPGGEQQPMAKRPKSPFKAGWTDTERILKSEIRQLNGRDTLLAIDIAPTGLNRHGGISADARIKNSAVVLELTSGADRLTFPCDAFNWWQDNVRAIALALGDLRRVDRYRVNRGKQYEGFKALGSGSGPGGAAQPLTVEQAAAIISKATKLTFSEWEITASSERAVLACRAAKAATHPDVKGGSDEKFTEVGRAEAALLAHHQPTGARA